MLKIARLNPAAMVARPFPLSSLPAGWLYEVEASLLYNAALTAKGPVLEIGSWIGRSTCCLAAGIRDNRQTTPIFDVFDFGLASVEEWVERFKEDPLSHPSRGELLPVIYHPGGSVGLLKKNLTDRGLNRFVNMLCFGDFRTSSVSRIYDVCFCDASHSVAEIQENVPALMRMMRSDAFLICFDDIVTEAAAQAIVQIVKPDLFVQSESQAGLKIAVCAKGEYASIPWLGGAAGPATEF